LEESPLPFLPTAKNDTPFEEARADSERARCWGNRLVCSRGSHRLPRILATICSPAARS
jgi:hypothetical protein